MLPNSGISSTSIYFSMQLYASWVQISTLLFHFKVLKYCGYRTWTVIGFFPLSISHAIGNMRDLASLVFVGIFVQHIPIKWVAKEAQQLHCGYEDSRRTDREAHPESFQFHDILRHLWISGLFLPRFTLISDDDYSPSQKLLDDFEWYSILPFHAIKSNPFLEHANSLVTLFLYSCDQDVSNYCVQVALLIRVLLISFLCKDQNFRVKALR